MLENTVAKHKPCGETLQQSTVFERKKQRSKIFNQLKMRKIKSTKIILKKKRKKREKREKKNHTQKHCNNP